MIYDVIILPLLFLLRALVIPFIPKAKLRVLQEKRSRHYEGAKSFHEDGITADLAVEFSSEGEFQQCLPLVEAALHEGKNVELIYFSPSVEKGVRAFHEKYPIQTRVLHFPLLTYWPNRQCSMRRWVTAKKMILVRYDFLPEILLWARNPENKLVLIWASFKKKRLKSQMLSAYQLLFLKAAKTIIAATMEDKLYIEKHGVNVSSVFDFRIVQIMNRLKNREQTLFSKFPVWEKFEAFLSQVTPENRFLLGNGWPIDLSLLSGDFINDVKAKRKLLVIVPHLVGGEHKAVWKQRLAEIGLQSYEISPENSVGEMLTGFQNESGAVVIHLKGILCELYHYFGFSYVGGGLGVSVHSLLEPYVAGSQFISCGPKVERSTEFDLTNQDFPATTLLQTSSEFDSWIRLNSGDNVSDREKRLEMIAAEFDHLRKRL